MTLPNVGKISPKCPTLTLVRKWPIAYPDAMSDVSYDSVSQPEAGRWLTIQEAAHHLSVSERTIYRRADSGKLLRQTHPDGRVEVWIPDAPLTEPSDVSPDSVSQERAVILVDRVSAAVSRQLEALTVELTASRERIEVLARENGMLGERVVGLERELTDVRQLSDDDRHRLTAELATARAALLAQEDTQARLQALEALTVAPTVSAPTEPSVPLPGFWVRWRWPLVVLLALCVALALIFMPR